MLVALLEIVIDARLLQLLNISSAILVIPLGIAIEVKPMQL